MLTNRRFIALMLLVVAVLSSCAEKINSFQVICDSIIAQPEITEFTPDATGIYRVTFSEDSIANLLLEQGPLDSDFSRRFNTYRWNLQDGSATNLGERTIKYRLPCDCEAKVVDESSDGNWQIIDTKMIVDDGRLQLGRWLINQNNQYSLGNTHVGNWFWSSDGMYFSYIIVPESGPIGTQVLINLETMEPVWISLEEIERFFDNSDIFLEPWPLSHNITFSLNDKTYWYRAWFAEDQNKIYVYDPINQEGRIEHIENIRSVIWNDALNQLLFIKSTDEYISITSKDETISAKIPYDLYLEIDGEGLESELTHTNFQLSPEGRYVVFPKKGQLYALGCNNE